MQEMQEGTEQAVPEKAKKEKKPPTRKQLTVRVTHEMYDRIDAARPDGVGGNEWAETLLERGLAEGELTAGPVDPEATLALLRDYDPKGLEEFKRKVGVLRAEPTGGTRTEHFEEARLRVQEVINRLVIVWGDRVDTRGSAGLRAKVDEALRETSA